MSNAIKCDVCKRCFDPLEVGGLNYFTTIKEVVCQTGEEYANNEFNYYDEMIHLCPSCSKEFINFSSGINMVPEVFLKALQAENEELRKEKEELEHGVITKIQENKEEIQELLKNTPPELFKDIVRCAVDYALYGPPGARTGKSRRKPNANKPDSKDSAPKRPQCAKKKGNS